MGDTNMSDYCTRIIEQRSLLHVSATNCGHIQGRILDSE